jgi:3-methylcrotonyl-CoA carboxylase alpha subunit
MLAKLTVWAENREAALDRLAYSLGRFEVSGVTTNLGFLYRLVTHSAVRANDIDTNFIERELSTLTGSTSDISPALLAASVAALLLREADEASPDPSDPHSPWDLRTGWMPVGERRRLLRFRDPDGQDHDLALRYTRQGLRIEIAEKMADFAFERRDLSTADVFLDGAKTRASFAWSGADLAVWTQGERHRLSLRDPYATTQATEAVIGRIAAPMPGVVTRILAEIDVVLERNTPILTMEAMKVVHTLKAPARGRITRLRCSVGDSVPEGVELADFEAEPDPLP